MFTNLQVITSNSLMRSTLTVPELLKLAKKQGHRALALTDKNSLHGAIEFYEQAKEIGIKPIIGLTLDVQGHVFTNIEYPLILLAKNLKGYEHLVQLSSLYHLNRNNPIKIHELFSMSDDLIVISPDEEGEIGQLLKVGNIKDANDYTTYMSDNLKDYYLGLSLQNQEDEKLNFYRQTNAPVVALGNVQYLTPEDALPTKVLRVLESEMPLGEENQASINHFLGQNNGDFSLRDPNILYNEYKLLGFEEAAKVTERIAEIVDIAIKLGKHKMPTYEVPEGQTSDTYLRDLCEKNLGDRVEHVTSSYTDRLDKELNVISEMGFSDYFLIVWDIMIYAHQENIFTGSGRGSAAGSLVAFLLEITNVDPIKYNLLFERFLNKERFTLPDIDLDFPDDKREQILNYIFNRYGSENVAQIGTIGTYGAKSAIRDVNRVFGQTQEQIRTWAQSIPSGPDMTLEKAIKDTSFQTLVNESALNRRIYDVALKIEGSNRHVSTHAAAVVISDEPIINRVPLQEGSGEIHLTQYTMDSVEKVGLLKLDILGLRNLTILSDSLKFVSYENNGKKLDIDNIPIDDDSTLEIFRQGATDGVFQFESPGIRRVLRQLQPNSFEDVVAVNALYRPGPMEQIDTFIKRKNGQESIQYPHDDLKEILEVTYGIMVYQEQVMQVASKLAGYTLNEADILRRAISKKDHIAIEEGRKDFVAGSVSNGYTKETALEVYGYIERFADYGFNRSHAVAYSKIAYQLAFMKANFPATFFTSVMRSSSKDKIKTLIAEAKNMQVTFLGPNINQSFQSFVIEKGKIRFGFEIIQGLPRNFTKDIISERRNNGKYKDLIDFLSRVDSKWLKTEYILPLVQSGAFDGLTHNRSSLLHSLTSVLESIGMSHGNMELFHIFAPSITDKPELSDEEKMHLEFEVTGYYFSAEPGEKYKQLRNDSSISYLQNGESNKYLKVLVVVDKIKRIQTKNGEPMSFADVTDNSGKGNLTLFPNTHRRFIQHFEEGDTILVEGKVESTEPSVKIIANKIVHADELMNNLNKQDASKENTKNIFETKDVLYIRFKSLQDEKKKRQALLEVLKVHHGTTPVIIYDEKTQQQKAFKEKYFINMTDKLSEILEKMFGHDNFMLKNVKK